MKAIQKFNDAYLQQCKLMSKDEIIKFLDDFRSLHGQQSTPPLLNTMIKTPQKKVPSKLISMKVPEDLLHVFRAKAALTNTPYQTQIKQLMREWTRK